MLVLADDRQVDPGAQTRAPGGVQGPEHGLVEEAADLELRPLVEEGLAASSAEAALGAEREEGADDPTQRAQPPEALRSGLRPQLEPGEVHPSLGVSAVQQAVVDFAPTPEL